MTHKAFLWTASVIFGLVAVVHFLRISLGWTWVIGDWRVPTWVSGLAVILGIYLVYESTRLRKKSRVLNPRDDE